MNEEDDLKTLAEIADILRCSRVTVYRALKQGRLNSIRMGRQHRFRLSEVRRFLEKSESRKSAKVPSAAPPAASGSDWNSKYHDRWFKFVRDNLASFDPDAIILNDRRGAELCAFTHSIPENRSGRVLFSRALDYMTDQERTRLVRGKKVLIIDEIVQHGRDLSRERALLDDLGASDVMMLVCARRKSALEDGLLLSPEVKACFDLSDSEFRSFTVALTNALRSRPEPLDVDHVFFTLKEATPFGDITALLYKMAAFGPLHFPPTRLEAGSLLQFTIDYPSFFMNTRLEFDGTEALRLDICKLRGFRIGDNWSLVPIVFPALQIEPSHLLDEKRILNPILSLFVEPIKRHKSELPIERMAKLLFECLHIYLGTIMCCKFVQEFQKMSATAFMPNKSYVRKEDFVRMYGQQIGTAWHDTIEDLTLKVLREGGEDLEPTQGRSLKLIPESSGYDPVDSMDIDVVCRRILDLFHQMSKSSSSAQLSAKEIAEKLSINASAVSQALDVLLDAGYLKPVNRVREAAKNSPVYLCDRVYETTEYGTWQPGSEAFLEEREAEARTTCLIPYVIKSLKSWEDPSHSEGIRPTLLNKILSNLQHDWSFDDRPLFLRWIPFLYGPIPEIPLLTDRDSLENLDLKQFAELQGTYRFDASHRRYDIAPDYDPEVEMIRMFRPDEGHILDGLLEIYHVIWNFDQKRYRLLTAISACRNQELAYIHAYKEVELWQINFDRFLQYLHHSLSSLRLTEIDRFLFSVTRIHAALYSKIKLYKELPKIKSDLQSELNSRASVRHLSAQLMSALEVPITFSDRPPYPLANAESAARLMAHLITFLQNGFSAIDLASDKRKETDGDTHDLTWYGNRLIGTLKGFGIDPARVNLLKQHFMNPPLGRDFVLSLDGLHTVVTGILSDESFLPKAPAMYPTRLAQTERLEQYIKAFSRTLRHCPNWRAMAFSDLNGTRPFMAEVASYAEDTESIDIGLRARARLEESLKAAREQLGLSVFNHPAGGDSFLSLTDSPDDIVRLAAGVQKYFVDHESHFLLPKIALGWNHLDRSKLGLVHGGFLGKGPISLYCITEDRSIPMKGGDIYVTQPLMDCLSPELAQFTTPVQDNYSTKYPVTIIKIYQFDWRAYYASLQ